MSLQPGPSGAKRISRLELEPIGPCSFSHRSVRALKSAGILALRSAGSTDGSSGCAGWSVHTTITWRRRSPVVVHGELMARATASSPDSGASPPPSAMSPLTNSENPARSSGSGKKGDSCRAAPPSAAKSRKASTRTRSWSTFLPFSVRLDCTSS
jgi:hypothetical protein